MSTILSCWLTVGGGGEGGDGQQGIVGYLPKDLVLFCLTPTAIDMSVWFTIRTI